MRVTLLSLLMALAVAAPAAADSIVYTKDGNVWSARPDGSAQRQLTTDGGYSSPSQADDGTIVAVRGTRFVKLDRHGRAIGSLPSLLTDKPGAINAVGPFDTRISPDGRTIASWLGIMGGWYDYGTNTYYERPESSVVFQDAGDGHPVGTTMFFEEPSWMGDSRHVLLFDSMNGGVPQVYQGEMGADHNHVAGWFHDYDTHEYETWNPLGAGELSRDGKRLAALRAGGTMGEGYMARGRYNGIVVYDVHGFDRVPTLWPCQINDDHGGELTPPSWSADGGSLTWAAPDGIWVATLRGGCADATVKLVVPGGTDPDWGPADSAGAAGAPSAPGAGDKAASKVRVAKSIRRRALLRRGLAVRAVCPAACTVKATARARGRRAGRARAAGTGEVQAVLRVTKRAAKARRLTVKVSVAQQGAAATTVRRAVRVR